MFICRTVSVQNRKPSVQRRILYTLPCCAASSSQSESRVSAHWAAVTPSIIPPHRSSFSQRCSQAKEKRLWTPRLSCHTHPTCCGVAVDMLHFREEHFWGLGLGGVGGVFRESFMPCSIMWVRSPDSVAVECKYLKHRGTLWNSGGGSSHRKHSHWNLQLEAFFFFKRQIYFRFISLTFFFFLMVSFFTTHILKEKENLQFFACPLVHLKGIVQDPANNEGLWKFRNVSECVI